MYIKECIFHILVKFYTSVEGFYSLLSHTADFILSLKQLGSCTQVEVAVVIFCFSKLCCSQTWNQQ